MYKKIDCTQINPYRDSLHVQKDVKYMKISVSMVLSLNNPNKTPMYIHKITEDINML